MSIIDWLFGKKKEQKPVAMKAAAGDPTKKAEPPTPKPAPAIEAQSFLGSLSPDEKVRVSNLNPLIYHTVIIEKKGEQAPAIVMEDEAALTLLRKLRVDELEQLSASVKAAQEGDRAADSMAASCYKRACEINPYNDIALMSYGCALANQGNLREGIKWVEKAVKVNPKNDRARRNLQGMKRDM